MSVLSESARLAVLAETGCTCGASATVRRPHESTCGLIARWYAERFGGLG